MTDTSLYEIDIVAWADRQVEELRRSTGGCGEAAAELARIVAEIEHASGREAGNEPFPYERAPRRLYWTSTGSPPLGKRQD